MQREKSCGAIIFRRKDGIIEYLLLHYESGHWEFVKGHNEEGESDIETVRREALEEASIKDTRIIKGFKERIEYFFRSRGKLVKKEVVFYLAETQTKHVKLSFEHIGFRWLGFDDAYKQLTFKNAKEILKKANAFLKSKLSYF